ncbi:MAG: hypothetical protein AAF710_11475 [Planctomycetota bacterium]
MIALDGEGRIAADLPCVTCGYLLRMQPTDGACPECGDPVRKTLDEGNVRLMPLDWLRRVQAAAVCFALTPPLLLVFGLGVLAWLLGVVTLCVETPKNRPGIARTQRAIAFGGLGVFFGIAGMVVVAQSIGSGGAGWPMWVMVGVLVLASSVTMGGVFLYTVLFGRAAGWSKAFVRFGQVLTVVAAALPPAYTAGVILMGYALNAAFGGTPMSDWLEWVTNAVWVVIGLGGLAFLATQTVYWIVVAVRMRRVRREAAALWAAKRAAG